MDILKAATDWAKAELFSTPFFILFGVAFMIASLGFWQLGKTEMAKAYIIPVLVAGVLLTIIGLGLFFTNKTRVSQFETAYNTDALVFVTSEVERAEATLKEYKTIVFKAIPIIIAVCSLIIIFVNTPIWRASMIKIIAMLVVILLIDGLAHARIEDYNKQLLQAEQELKN
ncbi:hypothetical protein EHW67_02390 [Arenibacter aquaticus]|uniref:Uncharacterized protein n=1 Tax=Arenibacter aquaticus TaxID=2489054 RepID=A0A3S0AGR0_9FLAO|nr:hypothetical protein [Arenibacter aquaticus]RTE55436.1 hypothetical protein EHW67_02390 [Arenibacter aquaticus]